MKDIKRLKVKETSVLYKEFGDREFYVFYIFSISVNGESITKYLTRIDNETISINAVDVKELLGTEFLETTLKHYNGLDVDNPKLVHYKDGQIVGDK